MYKNILIATDGSNLAKKAVSHGLTLAKAVNANVTIVTVSDMWTIREIAGQLETGTTNPIEDYENMEAAWANKVLAAAMDKAKEIDIDSEILHIKDQHPAEGIIETATSKNSDLIVMASHGRRGLQKMLLGSTANEVVSHSSIPVLICR